MKKAKFLGSLAVAASVFAGSPASAGSVTSQIGPMHLTLQVSPGITLDEKTPAKVSVLLQCSLGNGAGVVKGTHSLTIPAPLYTVRKYDTYTTYQLDSEPDSLTYGNIFYKTGKCSADLLISAIRESDQAVIEGKLNLMTTEMQNLEDLSDKLEAGLLDYQIRSIRGILFVAPSADQNSLMISTKH